MHDTNNNENIKKDFKLESGFSFKANGKTYKVNDSFKVGRLQIVTLLEDELAQMTDNKTCHSVMAKAINLINKAELGEAYRVLYNKIESDNKVVNIGHYALRLCTAYINYEGEDERYLTDQTIKEKIKDWSEEGLEIEPFLLLAVQKSKELLQIYKEGIVDILVQKIKIAEALKIKMPIKSDLDIPNLKTGDGQKK